MSGAEEEVRGLVRGQVRWVKGRELVMPTKVRDAVLSPEMVLSSTHLS